MRGYAVHGTYRSVIVQESFTSGGNSAVTMSAPSMEPEAGSPMPRPTHADDSPSERMRGSVMTKERVMELEVRSALWYRVAMEDRLTGPEG